VDSGHGVYLLFTIGYISLFHLKISEQVMTTVNFKQTTIVKCLMLVCVFTLMSDDFTTQSLSDIMLNFCFHFAKLS